MMEKEKFGSMPLNLQFFADGDKDDDKDDKDDKDVEGTGSTGSEDDKGDDKGGDDKKSGKTFTQEQVTRMMTKEKNQGRNAALKELGIDPKDSKMVAMVKALIESQKSDEQKAAEKSAEDNAKLAELEQRAMIAEAKSEAMQLGVLPKYAEDLVTLAMAKLSEGSEMKTIIGEFKTKYPTWFGGSEEQEEGKKDEGKKTGQKGTGSSIKSGKEDKSGKEQKSLGARLAAQRKVSSNKKSYWS